MLRHFHPSIKPLIKNQNLKIKHKQPKVRWEQGNETKLTNIDDCFDVTGKDMKFVILWSNPEQYKSDFHGYQSRPRDKATAKPFPKYGLTMTITSYLLLIVQNEFG